MARKTRTGFQRRHQFPERNPIHPGRGFRSRRSDRRPCSLSPLISLTRQCISAYIQKVW